MEATWERREYETWDQAFRALAPVIRQQSVRVASYTQVLFIEACSTSFGKDNPSGAEQIKAKYAELAYKCGMYHQLGKALVPKEYQIWQNDFTEEERAVYKKYTTDGRKLVTKLQEKNFRTASKRGKNTNEISDTDTSNIPWMMIRESCEQHMERYDGSGYPEGRRGNDISPIAQIVGLAKELDRIASTTKSEDPFAEACQAIFAQKEIAFSEALVNVLKQSVDACRDVYRKYINYTMTIPKTIPLVNKHREYRPMGLAYYNTFNPTTNRICSYEAIPWFRGLDNDSETTETIYDVEPMLVRLDMLNKMAFFLMYEAADTVLRIQTCRLAVDAVVVEMFPALYTQQRSQINGFERLFIDQPINKNKLLLTIPATLVRDADEQTKKNISEYLDLGVSLLLDAWTPDIVSVNDLLEMGFANVRLDRSAWLKKESADLVCELHEKGISVFAKDVDSDDAKRWLTACGVKHMSGPMFSHRLTEDELIKDALLRERAYD